MIMTVVMLCVMASCSNEEAEDVSDINTQTVLVYMPWTGSASDRGLYNYFLQNLDSIEGAIIKNNGLSGRLVVFLSTSMTESSLYEVTYSNGNIHHNTLKTYTGNAYTTADGIAEVLNDVKTNAFALNYAMIVGCHGSGWTYKEDWTNYPVSAKQHLWSDDTGSQAKAYGGSATTSYPTTRFFGSVTDNNYATNIDVLAEGIAAAGMKMQFILFDDCYMANIETAYQLRNVSNYLLASTSEVMAVGMPYQTMWSQLAKQTPSYSSAVTAFHTFYSNYAYHYGALSAIDCRATEQLATLMKQINLHYTLAGSLRDSLQVLDGFKQPIFYDLGDYVDHFCTNTSLLSDFHSQLDKVVKYSVHTDSLYSYLYNAPYYIKVKTYSGITISDPSLNSVALKGREKTAWWQATH
jgi:hypothetical protein